MHFRSTGIVCSELRPYVSRRSSRYDDLQQENPINYHQSRDGSRSRSNYRFNLQSRHRWALRDHVKIRRYWSIRWFKNANGFTFSSLFCSDFSHLDKVRRESRKRHHRMQYKGREILWTSTNHKYKYQDITFRKTRNLYAT